MILQKGANAPLAPADKPEILVEWTSSPAELDISCFMLGDNGKVLSDNSMIFYNQSRSECGAITFTQVHEYLAKFDFDLDKMPGSVNKNLLAAVLDGAGTFSGVKGLRVTVKIPGQEDITYTVSDAAEERALVLAEVYKHTSGWKIRAVGRGFNGGLAALATSLGVEVEEEEESAPEAVPDAPVPKAEQTPPAVPQAEPGKVNLTKIDLLKKKVLVSLEKKNILHEKARVCAILDASGSMYHLYDKGVVQRTFERALAVAACMDDDGVMDVWFFGDKAKRGPSVTERDFENYVKRVYPKPKLFGGVGCGNNEPVVMKDILKKYLQEEPSSTLPTYILFFSDGGIYKDREIEKILKECSDKPLFWQFIGIGRANYGVLEKLDNMKGRYVDNADFFSLDDMDKISDEEIYERMLNEFPAWLREIRNKGILVS